MEDIKDDNHLIAKFMGATWYYDRWRIGHGPVKHILDNATELRFDSDWNWLMHAVDKIEEIGETDETLGTIVDICSTHVKIGDHIVDMKVTPMTKFQATLQAVVEFINNYNQEQEEE